MLKDYNMSVNYHLGKANIVVDALTLLSMGKVSPIDYEKKEMVKEVHKLARLGVRLLDTPSWDVSVHSSLNPHLL